MKKDSLYAGVKGFFFKPDERIFGFYGVKYFKDQNGLILKDWVFEEARRIGLRIYTRIGNALYAYYKRGDGASYLLANNSGQLLCGIESLHEFAGYKVTNHGYFLSPDGWAAVYYKGMKQMKYVIFDANYQPKAKDVVYYDATLKEVPEGVNILEYIPVNLRGDVPVKTKLDSINSSKLFLQWSNSKR